VVDPRDRVGDIVGSYRQRGSVRQREVVEARDRRVVGEDMVVAFQVELESVRDRKLRAVVVVVVVVVEGLGRWEVVVEVVREVVPMVVVEGEVVPRVVVEGEVVPTVVVEGDVVPKLVAEEEVPKMVPDVVPFHPSLERTCSEVPRRPGCR